MYNLEFKLSLFVWISSVLYAVYRFSVKSSVFFSNFHDKYGDFSEKWFERNYDKSDFDWETTNYFVFKVFPWLMALTVVSSQFKGSKFLQIGSTFLFILLQWGFIPLFLLVLQPMVFWWLARWRSRLVLWLCEACCIILIALYKFLGETWLEYLEIDEFKGFLLTLGLCWTNLRSLSYCLDHSVSLVNFLRFAMYLPTLFCGPFILHYSFYEIERKSWKIRFVTLAKDCARCYFWMLFTNCLLHFVYVSATGFQTTLVQQFDPWEVYGYGYAMGQFFHLKYVVLYGFSTALARFDGVEVPPLPRCIGRIHLYSDMWKFFDSGLYSFLIRYIYIPISKQFGNKIFASFCCFSFVFAWHGIEMYIFIWTFLNFSGVFLENLCEYYARRHNYLDLSAGSIKLIKCLLASPLLAVSAISNFYFFAGTEIGNIFFAKLFSGTPFNTIVLLGVLYCCCRISEDLRKVNACVM